MTKQQELQELSIFIGQLPPDTYLRKWLIEQRDYLASCMQSDIYPTYTMKEAREKVDKMLDDTEKRAKDIIDEANAQADAIRDSAHKDRDSARTRMIAKMRKVLEEIEDL